MVCPCLAAHLQTIPIGFVDNRWIIALDWFLWSQPHSPIDILALHWNVRADHRWCPQKVADKALLPNLSFLVAMPKQRYLLLIEPGDDGLMADAGQHISVYLAHDLGTFFDYDEFARCFVEPQPAWASC